MGLIGALFRNDSNSSSSNATTDGRVVGGTGAGSTALSVGGSNHTLNLSDFGAVQSSLDLAIRGVEQANATAQKALQSSSGLLDGAMRTVSEQQTQFTSTLENLKGSDVRVLVLVGLAVVGLGAVALIKKA